MVRFLLGVMIGAAVAVWLQRTQRQGLLENQLSEMQDRANAVLLESRRILEEIRREFAAAIETGRRSVEERAERMRRSAGGQSATEERPSEEGESGQG